jgi:hypothetical protein
MSCFDFIDILYRKGWGQMPLLLQKRMERRRSLELEIESDLLFLKGLGVNDFLRVYAEDGSPLHCFVARL